ncbi:hypothetical protein Q5W_15470 [Hydrogenophaga sp. PBC]|uniref:hypothetical protein n=1 Tax=Hydrogenophaga sp. PBC TaxID=795665 RepID=UPI0002606A49|nr:hypothetical protein [Hydrogenophaga sp. PBC]AOS80269.1 hypothetical protein Q5W_15470 [Hydrogenophaga sp. PBC]
MFNINWWSIGQYLLFSWLSDRFRPKLNRNGPAAGGLKDLSFPTVDPTRPHQWLIGRRVIDNANLFGTWDFKAVERSKKVRTNLFSKERVPLPPVYYVSSAMVLCGGTGARLKRVYLGDRVIWTGDLASGGAVNVNVQWNEEGQEDYPRGLIARIEFHSGSTTPNAYIQAKQGAANTPAFKHLTYVVVRGQDGSAQPGAWIGTNRHRVPRAVEPLDRVLLDDRAQHDYCSGGHFAERDQTDGRWVDAAHLDARAASGRGALRARHGPGLVLDSVLTRAR